MSSPTALPGFEPTQHYQRHARVALTPGSRVGEFEIVRVLGVGGFSIVYLARDLVLSRLVALKEYLPSALAMRGEGAQIELRTSSNAQTFEQGLDSFIEEARMLARFDHPSLVRVHHFWKANGTAYMAMRYLEGKTLLAARRTMPRPPDEAWLRALLGSLLGAIEALHAESCLHRDISPDNILLLPDGTPVLLDFGAARTIVGDGSQQLTAILKPGFAPIEQYAEATDLRQGPWTDLYALGAVVRNCITARPPIPSTVRAVGDRLPSLALEVRTLAASFPGLAYSPGFLAAIDGALALRPGDRPQSVAQFRQTLALEGAGAVRMSGPGDPGRLVPAAVPPDCNVPALDRLLGSARSAALSLSALWPAATPSSRPVPAIDSTLTTAQSESTLEPTQPQRPAPSRTSQDAAAPWQPRDTAAFWPPSPARLRRVMPWGVAAVLLGATASIGWRSFEEHRIDRDMAVIASSAAAAAEQTATPVAFAAPQIVTEQEPEETYTRQPPEDLPVVVMSMPQELQADADPDADLITELRQPAAGNRPGHQPEQRGSPRALGTAVERSARAAPQTSGRLLAGSTRPGEPAGASRSRAATGESPRRVCARQERYTDYVCMQRQCKLSRFRGHEQCANLRKTGWWGFVRLP